MELKHKWIRACLVDYGDLNRLIDSVYGLQPGTTELVAFEEWNNDSEHFFPNVCGALDVYEEARARDYIANPRAGGYGIAWLMLNKLVADRHIHPGNYLVRVCW